jgi:hypothetical protein
MLPATDRCYRTSETCTESCNECRDKLFLRLDAFGIFYTFLSFHHSIFSYVCAIFTFVYLNKIKLTIFTVVYIYKISPSVSQPLRVTGDSHKSVRQISFLSQLWCLICIIISIPRRRSLQLNDTVV